MKNNRGFTIVELLIVIVVIGILAGITVVAYNGIQQQGRNAQTLSAARQYLGAFAAYAALNNEYPLASSSGIYCLAQSVPACTVDRGAWSRDAGLETALLTVIQPLPLPSDGPGTNATYDSNLGYIPPRLSTDPPTLNGNSSGFLIYILEGVTSCSVGPVASGSWPSFFSAAPAAGRTYSDGNVSTCWVPLPPP